MKVNNTEIGGSKELKQYLNQIYFDKSTSYQSKIIGIILISAGIVFLYNPTITNVKIGVTAILIGILMFFLITEKSTPLGIDVKITTFIILWVLAMFFITGSVNLDTFFILIVLGILITRELTDEFLTVHLKKRMALLISMFLMIYIVFIAEKIISFLNI